MADVLKLLQEIITLTKTVGALEKSVDNMMTRIENHTERIIRLEQREELLAEKMSNRAITAVNEMNGKIFERLADLEQAKNRWNGRLLKQGDGSGEAIGSGPQLG